MEKASPVSNVELSPSLIVRQMQSWKKDRFTPEVRHLATTTAPAHAKVV